MTNKKIYSLTECRKALLSLGKELSNSQIDLALSNDEQATTNLGAKYGIELTQDGHASFAVDLTKDRKNYQSTHLSNTMLNKDFIPYSGLMDISLQSFHTSNYLIIADCVSADNPKLIKKGLKFNFDNKNDLLALISLTSEKTIVSVNVTRVEDPSVELYKIFSIAELPDDLFDSSICSRCPASKWST